MAQNDETLASWRSEAFPAHDFADFAQEFLRRNAAYRRDHAQLENAMRTTAHDKGEDLAGRWGLCFPRGSTRLPTIIPCIVVPDQRSGCHGHRSG